jgi:hypothetical protein
MLGEKISESRGKRTYRKVLSTDAGLKVEVTCEESGRVIGVEYDGNFTYWAQVRPDGTLYGEGEGFLLTKDGEIITWKGQGIGKFVGAGAVSYRGAIYFSTLSEKMARLNGTVGVFEFEVDGVGNTQSTIWEWK